MVRRRRTPPAGAPRPVRKPAATGPITSASPPPDSPEFAEPEPALPVPHHAESVHDALLDSVSPEALQLHEDAPGDPVAETVAEPASESAAAAPPDPAEPDANDAAPVETSASEPPPASIVVPARPAPAFRKASTLEALSELSESNATIVAFLRNEGSATLAHWRSLAKARSAADVVRLQVDEMQRAADASLTCINVLAKRAGRFASLLSRR